MKKVPLLFLLLLSCLISNAQRNKKLNVIAYYAGRPTEVDSFRVEDLTHIIFSFSHLKNAELSVSNARDSLTIQKMVQLKQRNPSLKVMLSLGGWGGCGPCSDVFNNADSTAMFVASVKQLTDYFQTDGLDLDWEYPVIHGFPGHTYRPEDKDNFTRLIAMMRKEMGKKFIISFAAGGFPSFLEKSVDWKKVMPLADMVNLMTYDLISGSDTVTGHHTALYSTKIQRASTDQAVTYLLSQKIPANKIVIGAAFYARIFETNDTVNNGLYRTGKFKRGVSFRNMDKTLSPDSGYVYHWDATASAPYLYNASRKEFVTFDDKRSVKLKTDYAIKHKLNGIMFWQLSEDSYEGGLLQAIIEERQ
ncbi:MAG: Chitinase [Chitinophagaceae bacterium]|nr:Chitinase [Chitinophagaceae bacterium]